MDLKQRFDSLTAQKVEAMKGEPEGLHLDAKRLGSDGDNRKNLAKCIAGFANAEGGIVLWGVKATKDAGVDCINEFPGVDQPDALASRLNELTAMATSPGVLGVESKALVRDDGKGYVATYVPESSAGPHMARFGVDQYIQRIGQSFLPMEHFQVADMFGRRARPELEVYATEVGERGLHIHIMNKGRGSARHPYLHLKVRPPLEQPNPLPNFTHGASSLGDGSILFVGIGDMVIHPGMAVIAAIVLSGAPIRTYPNSRYVIQYRVGALDAIPHSGTTTPIEFDEARPWGSDLGEGIG